MGKENQAAAPDPQPIRPWPPALVELYRTRRPDLVRLAYLMTGSAAIAEEVVQDAFVRVHPNWDGIRDPYPYVRASVANGCRSWGRHQNVVRLHDASQGDPEPTIDHPDELWDALQQLDPQRRAAVVLRFYEDLPHAEIGRILGLRPTTVRTTIHRALRELRREVER